jgi:hypothetical protein
MVRNKNFFQLSMLEPTSQQEGGYTPPHIPNCCVHSSTICRVLPSLCPSPFFSNSLKNAIKVKRTPCSLSVFTLRQKDTIPAAMDHRPTRCLYVLTWLLLNASLYVQGYTISPSCLNYGPLGLEEDLTPMLKEAMEEAHSMASLGHRDVRNAELDEMDNSRSKLFPGARSGHFRTAERMYVCHRRQFQCLCNV